MENENDAISSLRDALKVSPNNLPLRVHLAHTLLSLGRGEEAEQEFRQALGLSPDHVKLKFGLSRAFAQQGKNSQAMAVLESMENSGDFPAPAQLLLARLLVNTGNTVSARRYYEKAVELDASLADIELRNQLAIQDEPKSSEAREPVVGINVPGEATAINADLERPKVTFKDIGGMDAVKEEIRMKIIHPLTHPEVYAAYGKKVGGGILMYGPPGCGKTHLARATAGEIKAGFLAVGINDVLDMWIGSSEKNLHALFEQARRNKPCVIFFDEVDALAASRSDMRHHGGRHLINQFLSEMDGISSNNDGVLILAATNAPWHVDSAFRRPGRFDRVLFVPPPDSAARAAILRILLTGKPAQDVDCDQVAKKTEAFSGADLKATIDVAIEGKLEQAMKAGSGIPPLTTKDLIAAAVAVKSSTREWFSSARNYCALFESRRDVRRGPEIFEVMGQSMGVAYERGMLLYNQKRYAMAVDEFRREMASSPKNPLAMPMLALSLKSNNQLEEAMIAAKGAVAADPEHGFCYYALACVEIGSRPEPSDAASHWDPNGPRMLYCDRLRTARSSAMEAIRLSPRNPHFMALIAGIEFDLGMLHEALAWTDKGLMVQGNHVRCARLRARTLARMDRKVEAREAMQRALALAPDSAATHSAGGWTHLKTGDTELAVEHFTESLRLDPNDSTVHEGLRIARNVGSRRGRNSGRVKILGGASAAIALANGLNPSFMQKGAAPAILLFGLLIFLAVIIVRISSGGKEKSQNAG